MDKEALTHLKRRVGRMAEEQVRPLFDEARRQYDERRGCPDCHYIVGENWHYCEVYQAMVDANPRNIRGIFLQLRAHTETCKDCYIESYWKEHESSCEKCDELHQCYLIYSQRIVHLHYRKEVHRFELANGCKPANPMELAIWQDTQESEE